MLDLLFILPVGGVVVDFRLVCERCDFRVPLEETDREPEPPRCREGFEGPSKERPDMETLSSGMLDDVFMEKKNYSDIGVTIASAIA